MESEAQAEAELNQSGNPWEKVLRNVEIDKDRYIGEKDVSRMR